MRGGFYFSSMVLLTSMGFSYDVLVIGEEHGNKVYHRQITEALPELYGMDYRVFAVEQPSDLTNEVELYIGSRQAMDEKQSNIALWLIFAKLKGMDEPRLIPKEKAPIGDGDRILSTLNLTAEARYLGFATKLVDMPLSQIRPYIHEHRATGLKKDDEESLAKRLGGVYGTLGPRNKHMADMVDKATILLVGRGHTGESSHCVEVFLRKRGLSTLSIDLVGADESFHPMPADSADISLSPEELRQIGGIAGAVREMKKNNFCGLTGSFLKSGQN
jgi:hypothetical protein